MDGDRWQLFIRGASSARFAPPQLGRLPALFSAGPTQKTRLTPGSPGKVFFTEGTLHSGLYFDLFLLPVDVGIKGREDDKKGNTDQVLDAFYMGIVINQGMERGDHAGGDHVLADQLSC